MKYNECINEKEKASSCFLMFALEIKSVTFIMLDLYQPEVF